MASTNNASISRMYILYQMLVIGFSLLGPAIIFSMVVYAQVHTGILHCKKLGKFR